ncbi:F-box/kelch-repeat protein At1g67480-like [Macadamia integrifolia]|uniref:F-box/kelch-repeat protein At1g67480-like n=1 Tax=Macadamia integrifolia TaxID=60698 RepID=UPI001C4F1BEE|nr:F-box/kelch-repeat protein At1g67480-like [Macadamia integrifolia]
MPSFVNSKKPFTDLEMYFSTTVQKDMLGRSKMNTQLTSQSPNEFDSPILPGLPDDVAKYCLAFVPPTNFPAMGAVCKQWRSFILSKEFGTLRKQAGKVEEWLYVLTGDGDGDGDGKGSHWEVLSRLGNEQYLLPPMPGPMKGGFGVVVLDGKLLIIAGYLAYEGTGVVSADVYQYDSRFNRWSKLAKMNVARYDFAYAEVDGKVYAVGGYGDDGENLSSTEVYDPHKNEWTIIENLRCPRWGCFACGLEGKLYVMGGRSSFAIGNSRVVDIYDPELHTWCEVKNGCAMVTAHAVLGKRLFCMEWKNQRKLVIFNPVDNSWKKVPVPLTGSASIEFRFGILDGKLLLFSLEEETDYRTLMYDPEAAQGSEWQTSAIKTSGLCLFSVTIKA